jgi:TRAP-type uncharacterized transport system substrate-binding protein
MIGTHGTGRKHRGLVGLAGTVLVLAGAMVVRSLPPRKLTIAAGEAGGAYHEHALRYQAILARHGVRLEVLETTGSVDNLDRLRDPRSGVNVAFLQSGITTQGDALGLASLGSVGYEPIWVFSRGDPARLRSGLRAGTRMSIGPEGSGTRKLAIELIELLGMRDRGTELLGLHTDAAAEALLRGDIDVMITVAAYSAPVVHRMLTEQGISTASFARADAHVALRPYLSKLVLPQGVADLGRNRPPHDVVLVAPKTSLVVRETLHPAAQYLLLQAAAEVHSRPALFQRAGQFPAAEPIDLPLSDTASNFYKSGSPLLQRLLPFWVAALLTELLTVLIPLLALAYPLLRLAPGIYGWGMRRRVFRLYGELKFLETQLDARGGSELVTDLHEALEQLEARANRMHTPTAFAHIVYTLRLHIALVRDRLERHSQSTVPGDHNAAG